MSAPVGSPGLLSPKGNHGRVFGAGAGGGPRGSLFLSPPQTARPSPGTSCPAGAALLGARPSYVTVTGQGFTHRARRLGFGPGAWLAGARRPRPRAGRPPLPPPPRPAPQPFPPSPRRTRGGSPGGGGRVRRGGGEARRAPAFRPPRGEGGRVAPLRPGLPVDRGGWGGPAWGNRGGHGRPQTSFPPRRSPFRPPRGPLVGVRGPPQAAQVFEPPPSPGREARGER